MIVADTSGDCANCPMEFLQRSTLPSQTLALLCIGDLGGFDDARELVDRDRNSGPFELSRLIVFRTPPDWLLLATAMLGRLPIVLPPDPEVDDTSIGEIVVSLVDDIPKD